MTKKTTKEELHEIAAFINKRLEGFDFILLTTNPSDSKTFKYVSNLKRERGVDILFNTAVELELKDCNKLSKLEILNKIRK